MELLVKSVFKIQYDIGTKLKQLNIESAIHFHSRYMLIYTMIILYFENGK